MNHISKEERFIIMLCKKGLIPEQHHAFFNSQAAATFGGKKADTDSNSDPDSEEDESSDTH